MAERQPTVILVHGYWMSEKGGRKSPRVDMGLRSSLAARATAVEYRNQIAQDKETKVFVDLNRLFGADNPPEGNLMAQRLNGRYQVPAEDIILREDAWSTGGEVKNFVQGAERHGWRNLVDIAFKAHHRLTIPWIYKKLGAQPRYASIEDILRKKDVHRFKGLYPAVRVLDVAKDGTPTPWKQVPIAERQYVATGEIRIVDHEHNHTRRLIDKLSRWKFGAMYWAYESIKWVRMHLPGFDYDQLEQKNKTSRHVKGPDSLLSARFGRIADFDIYRLNGVRSPFSTKGRKA
jgi:hypothetical protein